MLPQIDLNHVEPPFWLKVNKEPKWRLAGHDTVDKQRNPAKFDKEKHQTVVMTIWRTFPATPPYYAFYVCLIMRFLSCSGLWANQ